LKSSNKLIGFLLITFLLGAVGFSGSSVAGSCPDGSDPIKSISEDGTYFVYNCGGVKDSPSKSNNSTSTNKATPTKTRSFAESPEIKSHSADLDIEIYETVFSPGILDELLNRVVSKLDYDFCKHKLANNVKSLSCDFKISQVDYFEVEAGVVQNGFLAKGKINIKGSKLVFSRDSFWDTRGLSSDPTYLRDEVNIKLTKDGYLVGKMAYFGQFINEGQVPIEPDYPTLTKHKRSKPINLKSIGNSAELWIDVYDWAGGIMFLSSCKGQLANPSNIAVENSVSQTSCDNPTVVATLSESKTNNAVENIVAQTSDDGPAVVKNSVVETSDDGPTVSKVVKVIQGDKFIFDIAEPHELAGSNLDVGLRHLDAPDTTRSCPKQLEFGEEVRDFVSQKLNNATSIKLTNFRKTNIKIIADVIVDGIDLGDELLSKGYVSDQPGYWKAYFCSALQAISSGNAYQRTGDFEKSIFWYERALFLDPDGSNNSQATFALSDLYMANGDVKKSLDYLKQSAGLGYMQAEERLGDAYMYGNGVSKNKTEAKKWLKKAHDNGSKAAEGICGCEFYPLIDD
jgi:endonuclease YncB( thermonuclease family)